MASRIGSFLQDQNLNVHFHDASSGLKTNVTKAPKKGSFGGRTPLGDLSNSLKYSVNQASKKQNFATKKKNSSKVQSGERKALSDISNSGIPNVFTLPEKKQNAKLNVKPEERVNLSTIAEEQFLHDHQQCIKAQRGCVDLDQFLQILGLDNDVSKEYPQPQAHAMSAKDEIENSLMHLELEEMTENSYDFRGSLDSIPACTSPVSPKTFRWKDEESCNFKLIESP